MSAARRVAVILFINILSFGLILAVFFATDKLLDFLFGEKGSDRAAWVLFALFFVWFIANTYRAQVRREREKAAQAAVTDEEIERNFPSTS